MFQDEVRRVGAELGPAEIVWRQPFPGPGLAIRIVGEVTAERRIVSRRGRHRAGRVVRQLAWTGRSWQCPVVLLADVRSVQRPPKADQAV